MKSPAYSRVRSGSAARAAAAIARAGRARGFTLVELMAVIGIAAILAGLAVPSFRETIANNRLKTHASMLQTSLLLARSEAIKRNGRVVLCKSANVATCTTAGNWQQGWLLFADTNNNAVLDAGETVLERVAQLSGEFALKGSGDLADYVSYSNTGTPKLKASDNFQTGTFTLCKLGAVGGNARQIELFATGRLTVGNAPAATCTP
jgi:type IV fimbrial biogenesis protein FimT